jgi:hypothetical protein
MSVLLIGSDARNVSRYQDSTSYDPQTVQDSIHSLLYTILLLGILEIL